MEDILRKIYFYLMASLDKSIKLIDSFLFALKKRNMPDLDLSGLEYDITLKTVIFDVHSEKLIDECLELQSRYCKRLFGGVD